MGIRMIIEEVESIGDGVWSASLAPSEVGMFVGGKEIGIGEVSVLGVLSPQFDAKSKTLSIDGRRVYVFNVGRSDRALIIDLEVSTLKSSQQASENINYTTKDNLPAGHGDGMFIAACRRHLEPHLVQLAERLLLKLRSRYPGDLHEGKARKWVNHPENFVAITIQNRDQSFAIYVKGQPQQFSAPSLEIKPDRPGYSRFKLNDESQLQDALSLIFESAKKVYGY